ncbi:hypothetical protein FRC03_002150 [Tulasnella sp. 419]|nr:hypothetical protein FRC02_008399 [Tulasnella sp. 418]KAG8944154.1 hypothetical protein FRC03_002150 [Tulasnella sp. 419]
MAQCSSSSSSSHPMAAKTLAAATGATTTALTMTPFDVIKTRMQTQPTSLPQGTTSLSGFKPSTMVGCCQTPNTTAPCVRSYSSLALSSNSHLEFRGNSSISQSAVCLWDRAGVPRSERVTGFWDAVAKVWRAEGVRGLWKGAGTTMVIAVPSQTAYMVTYDSLKHMMNLPSSLQILNPLVAGIVARSMISSVASPLELFRTRLQSTPSHPDVPHTLRSVLSGVRAMVRAQGVQSLWKGLGPTLWRDVPFSGIYWAGYESLKAQLNKTGREGPIVAFASGAISGTTAAFLTSPFDVLKTRRQALLHAVTTTSHGKKAMTATIPMVRHIIKTEGVKALYAGLTPRMVKIAPACGIMISCYEGVERFFEKKETL